MEKVMNKLEPLTGKFDKIAQNKYIRSIMNGSMNMMPLVLISSILVLLNSVPKTFGVNLPDNLSFYLNLGYQLTMGLFGFFQSAAISKNLANEMNKELSKDKKISPFLAATASMTAFVIVASVIDENGMMNFSNFGARGSFVAILIAFMTVNIFKFCIIKNITINLPKEVPLQIAASFKELFGFSFTVIIALLTNYLFKQFTGGTIVDAVMEGLAPLFSIGDSYGGIILMYFIISLLTWFGIHGSSMILGIAGPFMTVFLEQNQTAALAGNVPTGAFTYGGLHMSAMLGGSGATLMVTFLFMLLSKSKANKAIGKASIVPALFMVNEPILYGGPVLMNPYFFVPFLITPAINGVIYKVFVSVLGMPGAVSQLGFGSITTISILLNHNLAALSFVLLITLFIIDTLIYLPFFKAYDNSKYKKEQESNGDEEDNKEIVNKVNKKYNDENLIGTDSRSILNNKKVIVLCIGGGTSNIIAHKIKDICKEKMIEIDSSANTVNNINFEDDRDTDLIILSPQARSYKDMIKKECDKYDIKLVTTQGAEYINLANDSEAAFEFVLNNI